MGVCWDVDEMRADLEQFTADALELADELAAAVAAGNRSELAPLAANYMQLRTQCRRLRRALTVSVAG